MDAIIFSIFAVLYAALFIWSIRSHKWMLSSVILLVVAALIYDNGIIAIGHLIGEGTTLEMLNSWRFWLHAFCTPMLILFSVAMMREAGIHWAQKKWVLIVGVIYTIIAIIVEYRETLADFSIEAKQEYGALSYSATEPASGPPLMILLVLAMLLLAGIMLWRKAKWPWMLIGTVIMTIGSAVPINIGSNAITNAFELILLFTLVWTKKKMDRRDIK